MFTVFLDEVFLSHIYNMFYIGLWQVSFNAEDSYEDQKRGDFPNDMYAGQGYAG